MARAKYQVLVLPYAKTENGVRYCVLRRRDMGIWQFVSGGGEEAGVVNGRCYPLETRASLPSYLFPFADIWGEEFVVVPEYAYAVEVQPNFQVVLSDEHTEYRWVDYDEAVRLLHFDSNKVALWELDSKIKQGRD